MCTDDLGYIAPVAVPDNQNSAPTGLAPWIGGATFAPTFSLLQFLANLKPE
jgi:hypothetical protein